MQTVQEGPAYRGTGRTTKQMRDAPKGAVYIWPVSASLSYAKALAQHIDRTDLEIVGPSALQSNRLLGRKMSGLILDHACSLSEREWENYERVLVSVGRC